MWKKQRRPCLVIEGEESLEVVTETLCERGYKKCIPYITALPHNENELISLRRRFERRGKPEQIHVQIVCLTEGGPDDIAFGDTEDGKPLFAVYAHTEPPVGKPIKHLWAGFRDKVSGRSGNKVLQADLADLMALLEEGPGSR